ncbi:hypothetical protein H2200_009597 [Cladophialophora chaetospira]|uniref:F-box domain-containing protein n=1 Tax=Cladophialophora chaetospira TaxID=386627 RepID=A0AA38X2Q5_9EURO|nr:hypothetical protein H2200_009597 [Cladophialophora chaetospira]
MGPEELLLLTIQKHFDDCADAVANEQLKQALTAVTQAIAGAGEYPELSSRARDLRYTIYLRLRRVEDAREAPSDSLDYLRCAEIERVRNHTEAAALAHFKHIMRNGMDALKLFQCLKSHNPSTDYHAEDLALKFKSLYDHIRREIVLSKRRDPMLVLPLEIVRLILSYIGYRNQIQLLRVSKTWSKILHSLPPIFDTLTFQGASKPITPEQLNVALERCTMPKQANLCNLIDASKDCVRERLSYWPKFQMLERLKLNMFFDVWDLSVHKHNLKSLKMRSSSVPMIWIANVLLHHCEFLETVFVDNVTLSDPEFTLKSKSLKNLNLRLDRTEAFDEASPNFKHVSAQLHYLCASAHFVWLQSNLFSGLPRLQNLTFWGFSFANNSLPMDLRHMENLKYLGLIEVRCPELYLPQSIHTLTLDNCDFFEQDSMHDFPALARLEILTFRGDEYPQFLIQATSKTTSSKLRTCSLESTYFLPEELVSSAWLTRSCPSFKDLDTLLLTNVNLVDSQSQPFIRICPNLRQLFLVDMSEITEAFLVDLIKRPNSKVEKIHLSDCPGVSEDFATSAEAEGVMVIDNYSVLQISEAFVERTRD